MRVRADENLAAEVVERAQELAARVELRLAAAVDGAAVDLERDALPHQVLHGLERRRRVARVGLVQEVRLVVEARHQVEVADPRAPEAVVHPGLEVIVRAGEGVIVIRKELVAQTAHVLHAAVDGEGGLGFDVQKVR